MGMLVESSSFEDVILQLGICSSGSLNGVIKGTQYNRPFHLLGSFGAILVTNKIPSAGN